MDNELTKEFCNQARRMKIKQLERELNNIPREKRFNLGGAGVMLLHEIHRLKCELEAE